ncbi:MAG: hypothetical protein L0215_21525 [Gemmataceae bacterium]|nr:hypothetical protein [Gemmataceae bacterium]
MTRCLALWAAGLILLANIETAPAIAKPQYKTELAGHTSQVRSVTFSADDKLALSAGGQVIVWSVKTAEKVLALREDHAGSPALFSPDSQSVIARERTGNYLGIWSLKDGKRTGRIPIPEGLYCMAMSNDGELLALALTSNVIHLIDWKSKKTMDVLKLHKQGRGFFTESLAFSPDGKLLASAGGNEGSAVVWDLKNKKLIDSFSHLGSGSMTAVAFSRDGKLIATGGVSNNIIVWDANSGAMVQKINVFQIGVVRGLAFSPKDDVLAIIGGQPIVRFWLAKTNELIGYQGHKISVESLAFSHDGMLLITGGNDDKALIWEVPSR